MHAKYMGTREGEKVGRKPHKFCEILLPLRRVRFHPKFEEVLYPRGFDRVRKIIRFNFFQCIFYFGRVSLTWLEYKYRPRRDVHKGNYVKFYS